MKLTWQTDSSLALTAISPEMRALLKFDEAAAPITISDIAGPDGPYDFGIIAHEWALEKQHVQFDKTFEGVTYRMDVEPLYAVDGSVIGCSGAMQVVQDVLAAQRRRFIVAHAEALTGAGSWYYDALTGECEWSDGLYALLGADAGTPHTHTIRSYDEPEDASKVALAVEQARLSHAPYAIDHRIVRGDGVVRFVQEKATLCFDERGQLTHVIGTLLDITERKLSETRLEYLAYHDPLSDLPNRTLLEEQFAVSLERARFRESFCGVLFIDIDGFKTINDTFGHACGDDLLRAIAARLRRHVRSGDTLARLGGDEFVLLMDSLDQQSDAQKVAKSVLEIFSDPFTLGSHRINITASIGIAVAPPDGTTLASILQAADEAMYRAKRQGGSRSISAAPPADILSEMVG